MHDVCICIYIYICACMHYVHKPVKPSPNNNCPPFSIYSALPVFPCRARLPLVSIVILVMNPSPGFILRLPLTPPNTPYTSHIRHHHPSSSSIILVCMMFTAHLSSIVTISITSYISLINATISLRSCSITSSPRLSPTRSLGPNTPKSNLSFRIAASTSNVGCIW